MANKNNQNSNPFKELENRLKNQKISFSFEYYDAKNEKYSFLKWSKDQILETIARLKDISSKTFNEMRKDSRVYSFSEVIWERTIFPKGFTNPTVNSLQAFHFGLLGVNRQLARVFGAYARGVFYIVWFDLNHEIWPTPLKNT